jgi:hypothetical protein
MFDARRVPEHPHRAGKDRMGPILSSIAKALNKSRRELATFKGRSAALRVDAALAHDALQDAPPGASAASRSLDVAERDLVSGEEWQRHLTGELRFLERLEAEVAAFARARAS